LAEKNVQLLQFINFGTVHSKAIVLCVVPGLDPPNTRGIYKVKNVLPLKNIY